MNQLYNSSKIKENAVSYEFLYEKIKNQNNIAPVYDKFILQRYEKERP